MALEARRRLDPALCHAISLALPSISMLFAAFSGMLQVPKPFSEAQLARQVRELVAEDALLDAHADGGHHRQAAVGELLTARH